MFSPLLLSLVGGSMSGVAIHLGLFIHGEWHLQSPDIVRAYGGLTAVLVASTAWKPEVCGYLLLALWTHWTGLITSIVVYRVFFHRLTRAGFDGPLLLRVSKLYHVWQCRESKNYLYLDRLHRQYGPVVRTGPAEVTVFLPDAFEAIDGRNSVCTKAEWYDLMQPKQALVTTRDKDVHHARRREWLHGFSAQALTNARARARRYLDQLERILDRHAADDNNAPIDLTEMFLWFSFDAMSDVTLSKGFEMLHYERWHHIVMGMQRARSLLGPLGPAPWLFHVGLKLGPRVGLIKGWWDMTNWCGDQMAERVDSFSAKAADGQKDLTYYLMERDSSAKTSSLTGDKRRWLTGDSLLAIVAGSEPQASSLAGIFSELVRHPEHFDKLRDELATASAEDGSKLDLEDPDPRILAQLPHLNAVIDEGMRLHPAALTGGVRKTPSDCGVAMGDIVIPPETTIVAPRFTISRREDCFERGAEFIPERWTTRPEMCKNAAAFSPFGHGPHTCVGNRLALNAIRLVIARLITRYRIRLAPGVSPRAFDDETLDHFTSLPGKLPVLLERIA